MACSLSNIADNLAEGIQKNKCKYEHDKKNMEQVELNAKTVSERRFNSIKMYFLKQELQKTFDEDLKKQLANKYKFSSHDVNKFIFAVTRRYLSI